MITKVHGKTPVGVLYCHMDFPERQELVAKAKVSEGVYHKLKILLLVGVRGLTPKFPIHWDPGVP